MTKTKERTKYIDTFVEALLKEKDQLQPAIIAEKISLDCDLYPPIEKDRIVTACYSMGVDSISFDILPNNLRGFHQIYGNRIEISLRHDDWEGGISHTLLHELFEIIIECYNSKAKEKYDLTEYKANLFAASVLMPEKRFLEFCFRAKFDLQLIRRKYFHALFSLMLRLCYLFQRRNAYYIGILAENNEAYEYQRPPAECNYFENFKITEITLSSTGQCVSPDILYKFLERTLSRIVKIEEDDFFGTIEIENNDFLITASPITNPKRNSVIKQIGIHVISKEDWERIKQEVFQT
ncbi:MAG: hypothetical protein JRJ00_12340 [Deltaproteobacteria bacterium]|nr:hypothetical protein [Deltaproteobacteria bacterium]